MLTSVTTEVPTSLASPSWLRLNSKFLVTLLGLERLADKVNHYFADITNLNISKNSSVLGRSIIHRSADLDLLRAIKGMNMTDTYNQLGSCISEVTTLFLIDDDVSAYCFYFLCVAPCIHLSLF